MSASPGLNGAIN